MKNLQLIIIIFTAFTSSIIAQEEIKVAVFDPVADIDKTLIEILREEISSTIVNTKGFVALERQLINKVLEENRFQGSGLVGEAQISEIGRVMGADYVLVTTISTLGTNYYISCKLVEVTTAQIKMQETGVTKYGTDDLMKTTQTIVSLMLASRVLHAKAIEKTDTEETKTDSEITPGGSQVQLQVQPKPQPVTATVTDSSVFTTQGGAVFCDGIKMEKAQLLSLLDKSPDSKKRYLSGMKKSTTGMGLIIGGAALPVIGGGVGFLIKSEKIERDGNNIVQRSYNNWKTYAFIGAVAGAGVLGYGIYLKSAGSKEVRGSIDAFSAERKKNKPDPSLKLELKTDGVGLSYNF